MSDDEDEEIYVVERILYQKEGPHPETGKLVTLYLVKWENYDEEQCTWEPRENFNGEILVVDWQKQWQSGDILDAIDLKRVEDQMAAFKARSASVDRSEKSSEAEYHTASETEPAQKRQKLVHDAPLLTKKGKDKKDIARPSGRRASPRDPKRPRPTAIRSNSITDEGQARRVAAPPLHRPLTNPPRPKVTKGPDAVPLRKPPYNTTSAEPSTAIPVRPSDRGEPAKFHAIDMQKRQRRPQDDSTKAKRAETVKDRPFRNLQHQNNVRKKLQEQQFVAPVLARPSITEVASVSIETPQTSNLYETTPMEVDAPDVIEPDKADIQQSENDAAHLFFSDSEDEVKHEISQKDEDSILRIMQAEGSEPRRLSADSTPQTTNTNAAQNVTTPVTQNHQRDIQSASDPSVLPRIEKNSLSVEQDTSRSAQEMANTNQASTRTKCPSTATIQEHNAGTSANAILVAEGPRRRRNSLFNQHLPRELRSKSIEPLSKSEKPTDKEHGVVRTPASSLLPPRYDTAPPAGLLERGIVIAGELMVIEDDGYDRQLIKGDLLCHLTHKTLWIGAIKLMHVNFNCGRMIIATRKKEQKTAKLMLDFGEDITRVEYDQRSTAGETFSYYDIGTVEGFASSANDLADLTNHLEVNNIATLWYHPQENLMGVLYPCRSSDWRDFGNKPGREKEARLCIAFRQKFAKLPAIMQTGASAATSATPAAPSVDPRRRPVFASVPERRGSLPAVLHSPVQGGIAPMRVAEPSSTLSTTRERSFSTASTAVEAPTTGKAMDLDQSGAPRAPRTDNWVRQTRNTLQANPRNVVLFPGVDRTLEHLSSVPKPGATKRPVSIMLAYNRNATGHNASQQVKDWLINNGQDWSEIYDVNNEHELKRFLSLIRRCTLVVLFDKYYRVDTLPGLSTSIMESDYFLCWRFKYTASTIMELGTQKLFPMGIALCISEACFLTKAKVVSKVLKWFKGYVQKPYASSMVMLPPDIIHELAEEAKLLTSDSDKKGLIDLAGQVQELITIAAIAAMESNALASPTEPNLTSLQVIETNWDGPYRKIQKERPKALTDIQKQTFAKEGDLNVYFAAWVLLNLHRHRKFIALRAIGGTSAGGTHVQGGKIDEWAKRNIRLEGSTDDRGRRETREAGGKRSRSVSRGSIAPLTPGRSPATRY